MSDDAWVTDAETTREADYPQLRRDRRCGRFYGEETMTPAADAEHDGQYEGTDDACVEGTA